VIFRNLALRSVSSYNVYGRWVSRTPIGPRFTLGPWGAIRVTFLHSPYPCKASPRTSTRYRDPSRGSSRRFVLLSPAHPFRNDEGR
jgi:hypothetical protein